MAVSTMILRSGSTKDDVDADRAGPRGQPGAHGQPVGMGLINLRSRVTVLGGQLHYDSEPGVGTRVEAVLPVLSLPESDTLHSYPLSI